MKSIFFFILCFSISFSCFSQAGSLDQSFGEGGKVYTDVFGQCLAVSLQADNKILAGGQVHDTFTLIRYLPSGDLDKSFGNSAITYFDRGRLLDIYVLPDHSILAAGSSKEGATVIKYKENGSIDSTFGNEAVSAEFTGAINAIQVQSDGKIVLAGYTLDGDNDLIMLLERLNSDGTLDTGFGHDGQIIDRTGYEFTCLALQPDGKIIAGGHNWAIRANNLDEFVINRYTIDGAKDQNFGVNGQVLTDVSNENDVIYDLEVLSDGTILATGVEKDYSRSLKSNMAVVKYSNTGSLYESFGENGIAHIAFKDKAVRGRSLLLQPDGKLIITGYATPTINSGPADFAMARLKATGEFDSTFGINGEVISDLGQSEFSYTSVLQPDGKIVLAGFTDTHIYLLARYNNDEAMPLNFTYFNTTTNNKSIILNWQTAQENNNDYFSIQRSTNNATNFNELTRINSKGNASQLQTYSYTDNVPLQGTNFYRLKQVDKDGKFSYSQIVSATLQNGLTVVLYPNPVKDVLHIKGLDAGTSYELSVMSVKGNVVAQTSINNTSSYSWNLQSLSKGVYYLACLLAGHKKTMVKFVKE